MRFKVYVLLFGSVILAFKDVVGFFKPFFNVAIISFYMTDHIAFGVKNTFGVSLGMHHRCTGFQSFFRVNDRRQHLIIHFDQT